LETFNVRVRLLQESIFHKEIEAESCEDAELIASTAVWEDEYTDEIRQSLESLDEQYDAEEICPECKRWIDNCECKEDE
jgi:hypothetical protein